ncbi:hypothetical protein BKA93DRAFT_800611 [Sparassis latifolia]
MPRSSKSLSSSPKSAWRLHMVSHCFALCTAYFPLAPLGLHVRHLLHKLSVPVPLVGSSICTQVGRVCIHDLKDCIADLDTTFASGGTTVDKGAPCLAFIVVLLIVGAAVHGY